MSKYYATSDELFQAIRDLRDLRNKYNTFNN